MPTIGEFNSVNIVIPCQTISLFLYLIGFLTLEFSQGSLKENHTAIVTAL